jgi:hypothetical protein
MDFGTEFTVLSAVAGAEKDDKKDNKKADDTFLTPKQWVLIVGASVVIAAAIELYLRHSGL